MLKLLLSSVLALLVTAASAQQRAEHVFIISIDGGKPAVIHQSEMPVLKRIAAEGAVTWAASTIVPPKTLPSHTSMLTGFGIEKHKVEWNNYTPIRGKVRVPTIFATARAKDPTLITAMFPGKMKFFHLWQPGTLDLYNFGGSTEEKPAPGTEEVEKAVVPSQKVAKLASAYIVEKKPNLAFIHLADPDSAGHKSGWGSPEQKEAFKVTDQALGQVLKAIEEAGIKDSSVVLISADHGGHDKTHGLNIPDDMLIPWIAWGKGVKKGHSITSQVTTYDTAATALWLLGVPLPAELDGKPVVEAFEVRAE